MAKILVVDDTAFMRLTFKNILAPLNHEVIDADDGSTALTQYKLHHPDLVVMDITMNDMDGVTALKELKKINPDVKVLMCSAVGHQQRIVECIENGAVNYVVKPFKNEVFVKAVEDALNK